MVRLFSSKSKKQDDPNAINNAFQVVLDEVGVPETERKALMDLDVERKQQLITSFKNKAISKKDYGSSHKKSTSKPVSHSPQYFVEGLKSNPSKEVLTSLRVRLGNQPLKWLKEFIAIDGVALLIKVLSTFEIKPNKTPDDILIIAQCLHSLKLIMNNRIGLDAVIKIPNSIGSISLLLDTPHIATELRKNANPDLQTQLDLFEQEARWDEQEQAENIRGDQSDDNPNSLLRQLTERTTGGPLYPAFISIMKLMLKNATEDDTSDEECLSNFIFVEKILNKMNGGDISSDDLNGFFGDMTGGGGVGGTIDIANVSSEKAVLIQKEIEDLRKEKKKSAEKLHEKDILLTKLAKRLKRLTDAIKNGTAEEALKEEEELESDLVKVASTSTGVGAKAGLQTVKSGLDTNQLIRAKAPTGEVTNFLSGLSGEDTDASADPAAASGGIPLPPGVPPPPPPPGLKAPATPERCSRPPNVKLKSYQWNKYRTRNIPNTFWTKVNYSKYDDSLPYEQIETLFAAAIFEKKQSEQKKGDVTVIDPKRAQNIGILLSRFKGISYDTLYDAIYNLDDKVLDLETINQMIKYVPTKEEIDAIKAFNSANEAKPVEERLKLGKAELFIDKISDIPRLTQRIQALHFKLNFPEKLYHAKPDIRTFNEAMMDLQNEKLFSVMELILSIGNFINYGTNRGNASGFKIDSINKMADTKSNVKDKYNLVHFLVELIMSINPNILNFSEEIPKVADAATLSFSTSTSEIRLLKAGLIKLEKELFEGKKEEEEEESEKKEGDEAEGEGDGEAKEPPKEKPVKVSQVSPLDDNDPFRLQLSEFILSAKTELSDAESLLGETEILYTKVTKFFGEDTSRPMEEFCAIFKRFSDTFQNAKKDLDREKELTEKANNRKNQKLTAAANKASPSKTTPNLAKSKSSRLGMLKKGLKRSVGSESESSSSNEDEDAIREYINSLETASPGTHSDSTDGEGMMDDVLNLIRDGDFRTIRRQHLSKGNKIRPPKPKPHIPEDTMSTYSSASSRFDAEPLEESEDDGSIDDFSDDDHEDDENEEEEDDDGDGDDDDDEDEEEEDDDSDDEEEEEEDDILEE
ncbi:actin binding protein [Heterostelium album PN500]|uniref:Actin binding protein n=1 Tax=Heterostelium pallidum (strain ATCC 26659 / Pp 5 / PN500) TaxID=670386 RepID=D3AWA0_HETP5|nr:actin binding protein [Heterostelium album PN500]EFA86573.1 actin binding protein [Heterostelium album PN500]|eukprot:XP_020438678.1 actin binding protein [Heterostelium album PN500]